MGKVALAYIRSRKDRHGRVAYWYFEQRRQVWPLPGAPDSPEFMVEYQRLKGATEPAAAPNLPAGGDSAHRPGPYRRGTLGKLVDDYLASAEFRVGKARSSRASAPRPAMSGCA